MEAKLSVKDIVLEAEQRKAKISDIVIEAEEKNQGIAREALLERMCQSWQVMRQAVSEGVKPGLESLSGLVGKEGLLMANYAAGDKTLSGSGAVLVSARAMGVAVVNASMGKIVAAPTAGSCGILPAVLLTVAERVKASDNEVVAALFTAAGIGAVIDENASTSGAQGGCQAECGAASCMAAAAAVELAGGTPVQAAHAGAIALKAIMGLVCDPVAGLVEIPCVKRNAFGAANALLAADMALAGLESVIPIDEVIDAMNEVSHCLPESLRETAMGGLANTPTAREIEKKLKDAP